MGKKKTKNVTLAMDGSMLDFLEQLGNKIGTEGKVAPTIRGCVKLVSYLEKYTNGDGELKVISPDDKKEVNILFKA